MNFDVVTANLHVVSKQQVKGARAVAKTAKRSMGRWPDVIGTQEAIQLLSRRYIGRYRVVQAGHKNKHDNKNAVLIKRWFKLLGEPVWHFGAPAFGSGLNHNPRHYLVVKYRRRGKNYAAINTHLSVVPEGEALGKDLEDLPALLKSHAKMALEVADVADRLRSEGYIVSVTADGNTTSTHGRDWKFALYKVLEQRGYIVVRNHLDFVAVHSSQARVRRPGRVISRRKTHSDHDGLAAGFTLREG